MDTLVDARTRLLQEQSTRLITTNYVEPTDDIRAERQRATFDVNQLACVLNGGKEKLQRRKELADMLAKTEWGDKTHRYSLSREEEYVAGLKGALGIWEMMRKENVSLDDAVTMRSLLDMPGGLELHIGMFIPTILGQGDPEQQAKWLPQCYRLQVIGTYAQTELGHGTFVRGLETTATFDVEKDEFIIHCPTQTSTKWWPGGMGKTATHAVVMARLIVAGRDYGPHAFIVQLRSLEDHRPMPGITVGDIGHKFGFGGVDNGFLRLEYVRIPRDHMLMRFAKVTSDGKYIPPPPANSKASYATMLFVRADIVKNASWYLSKAVTIAVRYTSVRRQTAPKAGQLETQVLDYQNVAHTLLPLVASAYSLHFMGASLFAMYKQFETNRDKGDFSILPELHILSSGLKALCTWITANGIEECRRTCGGHGYMKASGFPNLFTGYVQNVTWEGDNNVLCLQVARFLLKNLQAALQGAKLQGSAAYLSNLKQELSSHSPAQSPSCFLQRDVQLAALRHRAARLCVHAAEVLKRASGGKLAFEGKAWNNSTVEMVRLAKAHCACTLLENFWNSIQQHSASGHLSPAGVEVLEQLASLHAITIMEQEALGDLLEDGYFSGEQAAMLRSEQRALLAALRPNAVPLVDSFALEDYTLHSALGRYDGDVYRALYESAQLSRLNTTQEGPAWKGLLEHVMRPSSRL